MFVVLWIYLLTTGILHSFQVTALGPGGEPVQDDHTTTTLVNQLVGMGLGEYNHVGRNEIPTS